MKIKNVELKYYALHYNSNKREIEQVNVLYGLKDDIVKNIKNKHINNRDELKEYVKRQLMYYYWSKTEQEVLIGNLFGNPEDLVKIDVWTQVEPNLDIVIDYIISKLEIDF